MTACFYVCVCPPAGVVPSRCVKSLIVYFYASDRCLMFVIFKLYLCIWVIYIIS